MKSIWRRLFLFGLIGLASLCLLSASYLLLSNRNLPRQSSVVERLTEVEKARLAESIRLREALGDTVWPGWGGIDIPTIVYNEAFAFLIGYPDPPAGWIMMPRKEARGGVWQPTPGDTFQREPYYRQRLVDPELTPENFTVLVGKRWVATLQTKDYSEVAFYAGFREQLPPLISAVFPYRLAYVFLFGETENYIGGLTHEAFHAFQGTLAPERLEQAESATRFEETYPWEDTGMEAAWKEEMDLLVRAVRATKESEAQRLAGEFLTRRQARRVDFGLGNDQVEYERQREWLEGLAKYAELALGRAAASDLAYQPAPELMADPDFNNYESRERFWWLQLDEAKRTAGRSGETRFYYSGLAQAVLLDRLKPGWKDQAFLPGIMLENLVLEAAEH